MVRRERSCGYLQSLQIKRRSQICDIYRGVCGENEGGSNVLIRGRLRMIEGASFALLRGLRGRLRGALGPIADF